jgi:hypothetical protein
MAAPNSSDFIFYTRTPLDDIDWRDNWLKVIDFLTSGTYDVIFNSVAVTGNLDVGGAISATSIVGDGSGLTGLNTLRKNYMFNGTGLISPGDYTVSVSGTYGTHDYITYGAITTTGAIASTFNNVGSANCGRTGQAHSFSNTTVTGTGIAYIRQRLLGNTARVFFGQTASFGCRVWHNKGSAVNYTIYIRKANAADDFTGVTEIGHSSTYSVPSSTETYLKLENLGMGDCRNGIEVEVKAEIGATGANKLFEFTELQLELSDACTTYDYKSYSTELGDWSYWKQNAMLYPRADIMLEAQRKVYFNGTTAMYVYASTTNEYRIYTGDQVVFRATTSEVTLSSAVDFWVYNGKKLYFDAGAGTHITGTTSALSINVSSSTGVASSLYVWEDLFQFNDAKNTRYINLTSNGLVVRSGLLNGSLWFYDYDMYTNATTKSHCGTAGNYWYEVNTYQVTKRGGGTFGYYDEGVELQDGTVVSDTEALLAIKPSASKMTSYGKPAMDIKSIPKDVYVASDLPRDESGTPYQISETGEKIDRSDTEGEAVFPMISIMIGAIRELATDVKDLKARLTTKTM